MIHPLLHLFYPQVCASCGRDLARREAALCVRCDLRLPVTGFASLPDNPVEKIFWGRAPLRHAMAGYYFGRLAAMQRLVHLFKYRGRKDIARFLGQRIGSMLHEAGRWGEAELLVPVPLSRQKLARRGYNQAALLADAIGSVLQRPVAAHGLLRLHNSGSQTKRNREARWENVAAEFRPASGGALKGRHVLLIDDVLTTGATLEACARAALEGGAAAVSVCALAVAKR
ncbi:ComF family protein [Chitinophaga lutea]